MIPVEVRCTIYKKLAFLACVTVIGKSHVLVEYVTVCV